MGGRSEEREAFSSSVRRREKGSHQREGSTDLGFAMEGACEAFALKVKTLRKRVFYFRYFGALKEFGRNLTAGLRE